jgi:hypothetical protein
LKLERWRSPLAEDKYEGKKACDRGNNKNKSKNNNIIIIIIIIKLKQRAF